MTACSECGQTVFSLVENSQFTCFDCKELVRLEKTESEIECPDCIGTGEIDHDCDCIYCEADAEGCENCEGTGKVKRDKTG